MSDKKNIPTISAVYIDQLKKQIDSKKSQKEVADGVGIERSTVTRHYNQRECVNALFLKEYALYFGVSADYLLGLTPDPAPNINVAKISEYTGLSYKAVEALHKKKEALDEYNAKTQAEQFEPQLKEKTLSEELALRDQETKRNYFDFLNYIIETDARFLYTANINPHLDNKTSNLNILTNGLEDFAADTRLINTHAENATTFYQRGKETYRDTEEFYKRLLFACSEDFKKAIRDYSEESRSKLSESLKRCRNAIFEFEKVKKGDEANGTN